MKILYYSAHPTLSLEAQTGPGTHMREMIRAMRDLGHEVHPVIMAIKSGVASQQAGVTATGNPMKSIIKKLIPGMMWRTLKEFRLMQFDRKLERLLGREMDAFKPDLVYERAAYLQFSGMKVTKQKKCRHYMEINAPFIDEVKVFEKASTLWGHRARQCEHMQVNSPDKVYVVSSILKKYYMKYTPGNEKINIIPNCVNTLHAKSNEALKTSIIHQYDLVGKTVIGFVGSIFPYHGIDLLIKSFVSIAREKPDTRLLIVGDGAIIPELKSLRKELNLEDQVIFTGSVSNEDVFSYIDVMDITVMVKSNWYGSPVKIFEYGAMKKAIIAPLTSPVLDVMEKDVDALLTSPDEASISKAIKSLLSNKPLRQVLGLAFHEKVLRKHTWEHAARHILGA